MVDLISGNKETTLPKYYLTFKIGDQYAPVIAKALRSNFTLR